MHHRESHRHEGRREHAHHRGHTHGSRGGVLAIGAAINLGFVAIEIFFGFISNSMALIADAGHNMTDVVGLALAWGASWLARKKPSDVRTYGFRRVTIFAALANAVLLLFATGAIAWESVRRLAHPMQVQGGIVIVVAAMGVIVNGASALFLRHGSKLDLNLRGAFVHLAADAAISLGVVVTGVVLHYVRWSPLDPLVGILLSIAIVASSWAVLRQSVNLALDAVPEGIDPGAVRAYLSDLPGVFEVHDLHIWAMSTTETALTAHLIMPGNTCHPRFLSEVCKALHDRFGIEHATLQVEQGEAPERCQLAPEERV